MTDEEPKAPGAFPLAAGIAVAGCIVLLAVLAFLIYRPSLPGHHGDDKNKTEHHDKRPRHERRSKPRRQHGSDRGALARKRRQHAPTRGSTPKRDAARENGSQRARPKRTSRPAPRRPRPRPSRPPGQTSSPPPGNNPPPHPSPTVGVQTHLPPPLPNPQACNTPGNVIGVNC